MRQQPRQSRQEIRVQHALALLHEVTAELEATCDQQQCPKPHVATTARAYLDQHADTLDELTRGRAA